MPSGPLQVTGRPEQESLPRMHGGAPGSGAPQGNKNALQHGLYTREAIAERRQVVELIKQARALIGEID